MRTIVLSQQAEKRLHEIIEFYLANNEINRGKKVIESFHTTFKKIATRPFSNKKFESNEFINLDIRIYSHYQVYHIYYVTTETSVTIAEIFHVHQDGHRLELDLSND